MASSNSYSRQYGPVNTTFSWRIVSQSIIDNTSTVELTFRVSLRSDYLDTYVPSAPEDEGRIRACWFTSCWSTAGSIDYIDVYQAETVTKRVTIQHNADRTASATFRTSVKTKTLNGQSGLPYSYVTGGEEIFEVELDPVPPIVGGKFTSVPSSFTDEDSPTIEYNSSIELTEAKTGISFLLEREGIYGYIMDIPYRNIDPTGSINGARYTFNFTQAEKETMWRILNQKLDSILVKFYLWTTDINGQEHFDERVATLTIINYTPTLSPTVVDINPVSTALSGSENIIIRHLSDAQYAVNAQVRKGIPNETSISSIFVRNDEAIQYTANGVFEKATGTTFYFRVNDSRGYIADTTKVFSGSNFVDYIKLTGSLTSISELNADGEVAISIAGKYFNGSFGATQNRLEVVCNVLDKDTNVTTVHNLGQVSPTVRGSDYTYSFVLENVEYTHSHEIQVVIKDAAMQVTTGSTTVTAIPIFDWGRHDFNFNVPVTIQGGSVPTIVAQGTAGIWTYRTWSDGTAECWGKKDFTVNVTSTWGNMYTSGAISGSNISFPFGLFAETPIVNASLLVRSAGGILMAPGGAGSNTASMDQTGVYEIARGTSLSNAAYTINYQVIGRWK